MGVRGTAGRLAAVVAVLAVTVACSAPAAPPPPATARVSAPAGSTSVIAVDDPAAQAVATSQALYSSAPVVVLAATADPGALTDAGRAAQRLGVPVLLTEEGDPAGVRAELARLAPAGVLTVGPGAAAWAADVPGSTADEAALPAVAPPPPRPSLLVLTADSGTAAAVTALASGAQLAGVPAGDPRAAVSVPDAAQVVALGTAFAPVDRLARRLAVAATGVQLPGGGQVLFPGRRMVALYGHPGAPALGVLGEQDVTAAVARAQALAAEYQPLVTEPVVPAFEIISTIADSSPGADGDYSAEADVEFLRPWVDAAAEAGVYVVLDLQPGRSDFLSQAQRYTDLLAQPHVGLALDPEWRLAPGQTHLTQIGSVGVDEVNAVATWLADLTRDRALPQKLLMLHQFRTSMIVGRERLDTSRDELAVVVHADGFGDPGSKLATWDALHRDEPPGIRWGWKNFYDEDSPTFTPAQTVAIEPEPPVFVSYQ